MTTIAPAVPKTGEKLTWTKKKIKCKRTHLGEGGSAIPVRALVPALRPTFTSLITWDSTNIFWMASGIFFDNFHTHKFLSHPLKSLFLIGFIPKAAMYIFLYNGVFVRKYFSVFLCVGYIFCVHLLKLF